VLLCLCELRRGSAHSKGVAYSATMVWREAPKALETDRSEGRDDWAVRWAV
jgi:hypothetical protein